MLWFRRQAVWRNNLRAQPRPVPLAAAQGQDEPELILPYEVHSEALREFQKWFATESPAAQRLDQCLQGFRGDQRNRQANSVVRLALVHLYGGASWMSRPPGSRHD